MSRILYLRRVDVERLLDIDALLDALAAALVSLSAGRASVPPRVAARVPDRGVLGAMVGYVPGAGLEAKLVSVFPQNAPRGMRSHQALIVLFDEEDGRPLAVMDGTYITAVRDADVVACCTDAREPIIRREWLKRGAHVSSVGGTFGPELDVRTVAEGSLFVEWRGAGANAPPAGAWELQGSDVDRLTEVGEVLSNARPGRRSAGEVTVYKSTGHAVEDLAAARLVYDRARAEGAGIQLPA